MKQAPQIFLRLFLISALAGGGYLGWKYISANPNSHSNFTSKLRPAVEGITDNLNIDASKLLDQAEKKLVAKQPIMEDNLLANAGEVKGDTTTQVTEAARQIVTDSISKISDEVQNLPKKEAVKVIRQTCDQLISELDK